MMSVSPASSSAASTSAVASIVILAQNEAARIGQCLAPVIDFMRSRPYTAEAIVDDDGSDDAIHALAHDAACDYQEVTVCQITNSGKASAVLAGLARARPPRRFHRRRPADADGDARQLSVCVTRRVGEPLHRHVMGRVFDGLVRLLPVTGIATEETTMV